MDEALGEYVGELGINPSHLKTISREEIGGAVNRWRRVVESKVTLQLYSDEHWG